MNIIELNIILKVLPNLNHSKQSHLNSTLTSFQKLHN